MNILIVTNTYTPIVGGLEKSIEMITDGCRRRGHRTVVLVPEYVGRPGNEPDVVRLPSIENISRHDYSLRLTVPGSVAAALKGFRPDVVHSHHPYIMGGTAFRVASQMGAPLVFTYHTMYEEYLERHGVTADVIKRFIEEYPIEYANMCDHVIAPSESVKEEIVSRGLKRPCSVIPTGVSLHEFDTPPNDDPRARFGIPPEAYVIGHLGRISSEKNVKSLARQAARFMKDTPRTHMLLAGDGPEVSTVEKIFRDFRVEDRYHYAGEVKGGDVTAAYHAMDVFLFSSLTETQGIVLAEAMAAGLPVIAVDARGVRDIVEDKVNGRLIAEAGEMRFALWWHNTLSTDLKKKLIENARETAEEYSLESSIHAVLAVYQRVIDQNKARLKRGDTWLRAVEGYLKAEFSLFGGFASALARSVLKLDGNGGAGD